MKLILNTIAIITFFVTTGASAQSSTPYGVFNPLAMFEASVKPVYQANSAFYNYGNKGYDFVVESTPVLTPRLSHQLASLDR